MIYSVSVEKLDMTPAKHLWYDLQAHHLNPSMTCTQGYSNFGRVGISGFVINMVNVSIQMARME